MPSTRPFAELVAKIPAEAMARAAERNKNLSYEIDLATLRQARKLTQVQLAKKMRVKQPEVAKIERRADMLLSTLAGVFRALGAELKIIARFPDHDIQIQSLGKLANGRGNGRAMKARPRRAAPPPLSSPMGKNGGGKKKVLSSVRGKHRGGKRKGLSSPIREPGGRKRKVHAGG